MTLNHVLLHFKKEPAKPGFFVFHEHCCNHEGEVSVQTKKLDKQIPTQEELHLTAKARKNSLKENKAKEIQQNEQEKSKKNLSIEQVQFLEDLNKDPSKILEATALLGNYTDYTDDDRYSIQKTLKSIKKPKELQKLFTKKDGQETIITLGDKESLSYQLGATDLFDGKINPYIKKGKTLYFYNAEKNNYYDASGLNRLSLSQRDSITLGQDMPNDPEIKRHQEGISLAAKMFTVSQNKAGETIFDITPDSELIYLSLKKIKEISSPEEKRAELARVTNIILYAANQLAEENGCKKQCAIKCGDTEKVLEESHKAVALFIGKVLMDGSNDALKNELFLSEENGVFTFKASHEVLAKQVLLGSLIKENAISIEQDGKTVQAFRANIEGVNDFYYINSENKPQKIKLLNETRFTILKGNVSFPTQLEAYRSNYSQEDNNKYYNEKLQSTTGRLDAQWKAKTLQQKASMSASERSFYEEAAEQWNNKRLHSSIHSTSNEFTDSGFPSTLELNEEDKQDIAHKLLPLGIESDQIIGMNPDGTIKFRLEDSPGTANYDEENNKVEVSTTNGDTPPLVFDNSPQSKFGLKFISELVFFGNSDILDPRKYGSPDIQNLVSQFTNKLNDLFPADGATYFRKNDTQHIANALFHDGGSSIYELISNVQIVDTKNNTTDSLVNNGKDASILNRADIKPNAFSTHKITIRKMLMNMGNQTIKSSNIIASKERNNGKIVINKQGQLA